MNYCNRRLLCVINYFTSVLLLLLFFTAQAVIEEKPIVLLITSYNNSLWYQKNLDAAFAQNYSNFRIIYIDDCSSDRTAELVEQYFQERGWTDRVTLIKNKERKLKMENFYNAVHQLCGDEEIVIDYDGDDWLVKPEVLSIINKAYENPNVWLTYGSYVNWPKDQGCCCKTIPNSVIQSNSYRDYQWVSSHAKTFYAWLFKKIKPEDLMSQGKFVDMACDVAFMFPMLEMAGGRHLFIPDVLYIYNRANVINDDKVNIKHQLFIDNFIRCLPRYKRLNDYGQIYS